VSPDQQLFIRNTKSFSCVCVVMREYSDGHEEARAPAGMTLAGSGKSRYADMFALWAAHRVRQGK